MSNNPSEKTVIPCANEAMNACVEMLDRLAKNAGVPLKDLMRVTMETLPMETKGMNNRDKVLTAVTRAGFIALTELVGKRDGWGKPGSTP